MFAIELASDSEFISGARELAQCVVPLGLERIGDEPVLGIDLHESASCKVSLVLPAFDVLRADLIDLCNSSLHLAVDLESNVDRER